MTSKYILFATIALMAGPVSAKGNADSTKAVDKASVSEQKYCLSYDNITGSRVSKQECKTKREWAKDRVDIDKMLKN
jgi:hypothetical protein